MNNLPVSAPIANSVSLVILPHPLSLQQRVVASIPAGGTISEVLTGAGIGFLLDPDLAVGLDLDGEPVLREMWETVQPRAGQIVTVRALPGKGGRQTTQMVIMVAAMVIAAWAGPAGAAAMGMTTTTATGATVLTGAGMFTSAVISTGVMVGSSFLAQAIAPIKPPKNQPGIEASNAYSGGAQRNRFMPGGRLPMVIGGPIRIWPDYLAKPYSSVNGNDSFLHMMVGMCGPADISDIRLGDTPIENIPDVQVVTWSNSQAEAPDLAGVIESATIKEEATSIEIKAGDPETVRTFTDVEELSFDLHFPVGLGYLGNNNPGNIYELAVYIDMQYRPVGGEWVNAGLNVTGGLSSGMCGAGRMRQYTDLWTCVEAPNNRLYGLWTGPITARGRTKSPFFKTFNITFPSRGHYEVRWARRKHPAEEVGNTKLNKVVITAFRSRSYVGQNPVRWDKLPPIAGMAMKIKYTGGVSGILDQLNCLASGHGYVPDASGDYDLSTTGPIMYPPDAYLWVTHGPHARRPLAASRSDLASMKDWRSLCASKNLRVNAVVDYGPTLADLRGDIASVGRASPGVRDNLHSVVMDRPQSAPVALINEANSAGMRVSRIFKSPPQAVRVRFRNADADYEWDTRPVYADGYDENTVEETGIVGIELWGVTDPDQAYKAGRFFIADIALRPEIYQATMGVEHLVFTRGDWVKLAHGVVLVGLSAGHIKSVTTDAGGNVTAVTMAEACPMEAGGSYGLFIRLFSGETITCPVVTEPGEQTTLMFVTPIEGPGRPEGGELFSFGELGVEAQDMIVTQVEPGYDLTARVTLRHYAPEVHASDTGPIPEFQTRITRPSSLGQPTPPAPRILTVESGEGLLLVASASRRPRIAVTFDAQQVLESGVPVPTIESVQAQVRDSGSGAQPWRSAGGAPRADGVIVIEDVEAGQSYDIRIRSISPESMASPWVEHLGHVVQGKITPPTSIDPATVISEATPEGLVLRWPEIPDWDAAEYIVRLGDLSTGATLYAGRPSPVGVTDDVDEELLGDDSPDYGTHATTPLPLWLPGSYSLWITARDTSRNVSAVPAQVDVTVTAPGQPLVTQALVSTVVRLEITPAPGTYPHASASVIDTVTGQEWEVVSGSLDIPVIWTGSRLFEVVSVDARGNESAARQVTVIIPAQGAVTALACTGGAYEIHVAATVALQDGEVCEIWGSDTNNSADRVRLADTADGSFTETGLPLVATRYYWARVRDRWGGYGAFYPAGVAGVAGATSTDPALILSLIPSSITADHLASSLATPIAAIPDLAGGLDALGSDLLVHGELLDLLQSGQSSMEATVQQLQDLVSEGLGDEWDPSALYTAPDYAKYNGKSWYCHTDVLTPGTPPPDDPEHWEQRDWITSVTEVAQRVDTLEGEIVNRVLQVDFNALENRVDTTETEISQNAAEILLRATQTDFDNLAALAAPAFSTASTYAAGALVRHDGSLWRCLQAIGFQPAPTPGSAPTYWEAAGTLAGRITSAQSQIDVQAGSISLLSEAIVTPATEPGAAEAGATVQGPGDVSDLFHQYTLTALEVDALAGEISLLVSRADSAEGRLATAESTLAAGQAGDWAAIQSRVSLADFNTAQDRNLARLGSAEQRLTVVDGPSGLIAALTGRVTALDGAGGRMATAEQVLAVHDSELEGLLAEYMVKLDVNGYVAGFGLANSGVESSAIFHVDSFKIGKPGQTGRYPFSIGTLPDGSTGVCILGNLIAQGAIIGEHIAAGSIGGEEIDVQALLQLAEGGRLLAGNGNFALLTAGNHAVLRMAPDGGLDASGAPVAGKDYVEMDSGDLTFMYWDQAAGLHRENRGVAKVVTGQGASGATVELTNFKQRPDVSLWPLDALVYHPRGSTPTTQRLKVDLQWTHEDALNRVFRFQPVAKLLYGEGDFVELNHNLHNVFDRIKHNVLPAGTKEVTTFVYMKEEHDGVPVARNYALMYAIDGDYQTGDVRTSDWLYDQVGTITIRAPEGSFITDIELYAPQLSSPARVRDESGVLPSNPTTITAIWTYQRFFYSTADGEISLPGAKIGYLAEGV